MKKVYVAPSIEIEHYSLDTSIASNCITVVTNGPAVGDYQQCDDYVDPYALMTARGPYNVNFYEDSNCDCYTSGGGSHWTS